MIIQIHTEKNIEGKERAESHFTSEIEKALQRFEDRITRIEVHFSDENATKSGADDKKCVIEAKVAGMKPIAVTNFGESTEKAFIGAVDKIKKMMDTNSDKAKDH